jgi:ERF superfamily
MTTVTPESRDAALETEPETAEHEPELDELVRRYRAAVEAATEAGLPLPLLSAGPLTVYERMVAIIEELPAIGKTQRNQQQNFMFRGHDDVMNALNPLLAKHGVIIVPDVLERETATRQTDRGKTMYEVNLHVRFTFYGAAGDSFTASGWGEGTDMGDKSTSKAMTMAFKYVVAQAFALATAETSDADADKTSPEETTSGATGGAAPRGRQTGRVQNETFDPGRNLLPQAIEVKTAEDAEAIRLAQRDLDPEQPWPVIEDYLCQHVFGHGLDELTRPETAEWWKRIANAVVKAQDAAPSPDLPPTREAIQAAYAWAFKGVTLALAGQEEQPVETLPGADEAAAEEEAKA